MQSTIHLIHSLPTCIFHLSVAIDGLLKPNGNLARHVPFNRVARYKIILNKRQYQTILIINTYSFPPHGLMIRSIDGVENRHIC